MQLKADHLSLSGVNLAHFHDIYSQTTTRTICIAIQTPYYKAKLYYIKVRFEREPGEFA